ncbi:MAG: ribonuclease P protein component, partial [Actinomycetia bacterium]|nr:ribonuclease P protein component [Actinomycetes bacterium]
RIRAQMAARLGELPAGSSTVVRALPEAGGATSADLGACLAGALARLGSTGVAGPETGGARAPRRGLGGTAPTRPGSADR